MKSQRVTIIPRTRAYARQYNSGSRSHIFQILHCMSDTTAHLLSRLRCFKSKTLSSRTKTHKNQKHNSITDWLQKSLLTRGVVVPKRGGAPFRQIFLSRNGAPVNIVYHSRNADTEAFRQISSYYKKVT